MSHFLAVALAFAVCSMGVALPPGGFRRTYVVRFGSAHS